MKTKKNISENNSKKNKKVLVGISGGVDSSVSALLLKQAGYQVEGVFAKVWQPDFVACTWRNEMKDAMRVCAQLDIPFHFLDLEQEYKKNVGDYFIHEYELGRTPNPDVMCNTYIKFGHIYDFAMSHGFDYVATGHYAQNINSQLFRGADTSKDQSYFLWNVSSNHFSKILFPIGHLEKSKVRTIAQAHNLCTSTKKDSQGLCFMGPIDMKTFLKHVIKTQSGLVQTKEGIEIGEHEGVQLYTIGERHGFTLFPEYKKEYSHALYVIEKDIDKNILIVDTKPQSYTTLEITDCNILTDTLPEEVDVQFRYRQKTIRATVKLSRTGAGKSIMLTLPEHDEFIALGQSAVLYQDKQCLGGGIINKMI